MIFFCGSKYDHKLTAKIFSPILSILSKVQIEN